MWLIEKINKLVRLSEFSICCAKGKVILSFFQELLPSLNILHIKTDPCLCAFRQNIRIYNSALSFISIGAKIDQQVASTSSIYTFRIHREMYHKIDTLLSDSEIQFQFIQIYIYDTDHEIQNRSNIMPGLDPVIFAELQQMLHNINPYVNKFCQVRNLLKHNFLLDSKLVITNNRTKDP